MLRKIQSPYSGTELGTDSSTFCTDITSSLSTNGPGSVQTVQLPLPTLTAAGVLANGQVFTTAGVAPTSQTSAEGSGMTISFWAAGVGGTTTLLGIAPTVSSPGNGKYVAGDTLTFDLTANTSAMALAFIAVPGWGATCSFSTASVTITIGAAADLHLGTGFLIEGQTGWQFSVPGVSSLTQFITLIVPASEAIGNNDYIVDTNITGGAAETATTTVGKLTGAIVHDSTNKTVQIYIRRVTGSAASTLLPADITVRLVKRMFPIS